MTDIASLRPLAAVAVTVATIAVVGLARSRPQLREGGTVLGATALTGLVASMVPGVLDGSRYVTDLWPFVTGVRLSFRADALGVLFALVASSLWLVAGVYSAGYLRATESDHQTRYFAAYAASIGATVAVAFAGNLLTLFVAYELLTVATYPLVVHTGTEAARKSGRKYLAYTLAGGVAVLGGTALVAATGSSLTFQPGGVPALETADPTMARAGFALLVAGFGVKAALMPVHGWLPDAMAAPTPVSGLLHAVAVVKSGAFGIARVVLFLFGPATVEALGVGTPLAVVAAVTAVLAALVALRQTKLKRGVAYSTISQLSYIVLGIAVVSPMATMGALLHVTAHAYMKLGLFFVVGIVYVETHVDRVDGLSAISERLPATMVLFALASAGLVGLPLIAGFVSKWHLLLGLFGDDRFLIGAALLVASLLKLLFFWPLIASACTQYVPLRGTIGEAHLPVADETTETATTGDAGSYAPDGGEATPADEGTDESPWEARTWRTETRWTLLVPVAVALLVAVVFGVAPTLTPFYDLAETVVEGVYA